MLHAKIVEAARAQIGTRYRDRSQQVGVSLDCYGLLAVTADSVGVFLPSMGDYLRPGLAEVLDGLDGPLARLEGPQEGAVVVLTPGSSKAERPRLHFAILTDSSRFRPLGMVHVTRGLGAVVEEPWAPEWQKITRGFYAFKGAA